MWRNGTGERLITFVIIAAVEPHLDLPLVKAAAQDAQQFSQASTSISFVPQLWSLRYP